MNVRQAQARLRAIAKQLSTGVNMSKENSDFLASALMGIADGEDAETALNVKVTRGQRKSKNGRDKKIALEFAYGWIATAIASQNDDGLGLTLKAASEIISKNLPAHGLSPETIRRYWNRNSDRRERTFVIKTD